MTRSKLRSATLPDRVSPDHDARDVRRFLTALFPGDVDGLIELRGFAPDTNGGPRLRRFVRDVDAAAAIVADGARRGLNVAVGIASRRDATGGGKANLGSIRALWVDLDPGPSDSAAELEARAVAFAPTPSITVRSGAGVHAYWLLGDAYGVDDAAAIARVEATLKGLTEVLGGDRAATDASRVMRVPGTWNRPDAAKRAKGRVPARAAIARLDPERVYAPADFDAFTARGAALIDAATGYDGEPWSGELPAEVVALAADHDAAVARLLARPAAQLRHHADESRADFELARRLAWARVAGAAIEHALRWRRARFGTEKQKAPTYFARTTERALAVVESERERLRARAEGGPT